MTRAAGVLRDLGFGEHESRVIIALNNVGSGTVADLSSATGIHHANLYSVLEGLIGKGLVASDEGRPRVFEFAPLSHIQDLLSSRVEQLVEDLRLLQSNRKTEGETPTLIFTIKGRGDVEAKMLSMIARAKENIMLVAPSLGELGAAVTSALDRASNRGVKIRAILGEQSESVDASLQQRIKEDTLAVDLVVDSEEALISMPDLSICGWADNPLISLQLEGFLDQTWELARK
ncbi:MAG: TrmB family transcriptional regulator [Candidatus Thorarchaeota archaeon]